MVIIALGQYLHDLVEGEAPVAFHASHSPPSDGSLVGMIFDPTDHLEVDHTSIARCSCCFIKLVFEQCSH